MAKPINFRGVDSVVRAYELQGIGPWSIVFGNNPPLATSVDVTVDDVDVGAQQLRKWLEYLQQGGTEARYDLNVYKLKQDETEIDGSTKPYRGFTFAIFEPEDNSPYRRDGGAYAAMQKDIADLKTVVLRLAQEQEEEEEETGGAIMGTLKSLVAMPQVQQAIGMMAGNFIKKITGMQEPMNMPAKVAGAQPKEITLEADQIDKLNKAIPMLAARDPKLGDHLLSLANKPQEVYELALKFL